MTSKVHRLLLPYGVAITSTGIALLLTLLLEPLMVRTIGAFFYIAVIISTWYGGLHPGLISTVLSLLAINYYFILPLRQFWGTAPDDLARLCIFTIVAFIINLLSNNLRESKRKVEILSRRLQEESGGRLQTALTAAQMGMWDWDMVSGKITWSPEHESLLGLPRGSFDGKYETFDNCLHPDDRAGLNQAIAHALQYQIPYHHEFRVIWADESIHWVEGRGNAFYDKEGQPVRMSGTIMAIDERKQVQFLLNQQYEQQRLVAEMTNRIRQSLNLQEILQTTVDEVRQCLQTDRVIIFRFLPDWHGVVAVESCAEEWTAILSTEIYDPCFGENYVDPFRQGGFTAKSDIYTAGIDPCHLELLSNFQVRANLVVPIVQNNELWGLLIAHHCVAPRQWQESDIDLLRQLASQVSIALQQADLFEQVQAELVERRQTEVALKERESLLRLFAQYAPAGIAMLDREMRYVMASQRWVDEYELGSVESLIHRSHYDLFPEIPERWRQIHQRCLAGAIEKCDDDPFIRANGKKQWISWEIRPWHTATGEIGGIVIFSIDVTLRKLAEIELRDRERLFSTLAEALPVVIFRFDQNSHCNYISNYWTSLTDRTIESAAGLGWVETLHPEDRDRLTTEWLKWTRNSQQQGLYQNEGRLVHINGEDIWYYIQALPEVDTTGETTGYLGVMTDITARKQAEESLRQSEARLRLAQIVSNSAVWDWDVQKNMLYWSPEYYQLYRLDPTIEPGYETWLNCIHPDDREKTHQKTLQVLENKSSDLRVEFRVIQSNQIRWFAGIGQVLRDEAGQPTRMIGISIDITQQKQTEIALQQLNAELEQRVIERTEELYNLNSRLLAILKEQDQIRQELEDLYNNAPCGYHSLNAEGTIVRINDTELSWLGYSRDEVLNRMKFTDLITPESQQTFHQNFPQFIQRGWVNDLEFQLCHKDGTIRWINLNATALRDNAGNFVMGRSSLFDLSDRKQAEAALQQQARLEGLRWEITQAIRQSLDLRVTLDTATEQMRQTLQVDRVAVYRFQPDWSGDFVAESVNENWVKLVSSDVQKVWEDTYLQETQGGRFQNHETFVISDIYTAGLQPCHIELLEQFQAKAYAVAPIFLREDLWGLLAIYQNTTARAWQEWEIELLQEIADQLAIALQQSTLYSQLQVELQERERATAVIQEAERRWRSLLDNVQLIVVGLDKFGSINYVNPFFLTLTGYTLSEVLGKNWFENFLPSSHQPTVQGVFSEVLSNNAYPYYQNSILTKSGEERFIAWNNTMLQDIDSNVIGTISIGEDITERRKIDRMKQEFISVVSHELRTPLTSIRGSLGLIAGGVYDKKPEKMKDMIAIAARQSDRLVRLVNDILNLRRLESGQSKFKFEQCSVSDLIQQSVDVMRSQAEQNQITLDIIPTTVEVWADADAIVQTLTNLLSNAIKFSPLNSTVTITATPYPPPSSFTLFSIQDQGRGIPSNHLETIFDQFQQVDASDSREKGGTGLGLAICCTIVKQHGGRIWVESVLEQGSTFYFTLPSTQPVLDND